MGLIPVVKWEEYRSPSSQQEGSVLAFSTGDLGHGGVGEESKSLGIQIGMKVDNERSRVLDWIIAQGDSFDR